MKKLQILCLMALTFLFAACRGNSISPTLIDCEMALFENGKLSLYSPINHSLFPITKETDSVVNGLFHTDGKFYYCTAVNNRIFLKSIDLNVPDPEPVMLADLNLNLDDCLDKIYGDMAYLDNFPEEEMIGQWYGFSYDGLDFNNCKLYDPKTGKVTDFNHDHVLQSFYCEREGHKNPHFNPDDFKQIGNDYYYKDYCLTDQMNLMSMDFDPYYPEELEFVEYSVDPTETMVSFYAIIASDDCKHGPICIASLDGKFQKVLEDTDICTSGSSWLSDGSFVFTGSQPRPIDDPEYNEKWNYSMPCIKIMYPDHQIVILSQGKDMTFKKLL